MAELSYGKFARRVYEIMENAFNDAKKDIDEYTCDELYKIAEDMASLNDRNCESSADPVIRSWCSEFENCLECHRAMVERLVNKRQDHDCVWVVSKVYGDAPSGIVDRVFTSQESAVGYLKGKTLTLDLTLKDTGGASLRYDYAHYSGCYIDTMAMPSYVITRFELDA